MKINTKSQVNLNYTFGSLITLSAQFTTDGGSLIDPINPRFTIVNEVNNLSAMSGHLLKIAKGYYFFNVPRLDVGRYVVTYFGSELAANPDNGYVEVTSRERIEIIPIIGKQILPIDPLSKLRIDLRDNNVDPDLWVWTDIELEEYLNQALSDINITPRRTQYTWLNVPDNWIQCIKRGAQERALYAKSTEVAHQPISYTDKGVSIDKRAQAQFYKTLADQMHTIFAEEKKIIKRNHYPKMGWSVTSDLPYITIPPLRSTGRIFW